MAEITCSNDKKKSLHFPLCSSVLFKQLLFTLEEIHMRNSSDPSLSTRLEYPVSCTDARGGKSIIIAVFQL